MPQGMGRSASEGPGSRTPGGRGFEGHDYRGGAAGGGGISRGYQELANRNQFPGYKGPGGTTNPDTSFSPNSLGLSQDAMTDYNKAQQDYLGRSKAWDVADFIGGPFLDVNKPTFNTPQSFNSGTWHTSQNPGGMLAGLAGLAVPGLGLAAGPLGSFAWNKLGLPDIWNGQSAGSPSVAPAKGPSYASMKALKTGLAIPQRPLSAEAGREYTPITWSQH